MTIVGQLSLGVLCLLLFAPMAWGVRTLNNCTKWFTEKHYALAGACFALSVPDKDVLSDLPRSQQLALGRRLRNAALAFSLAAKQAPKLDVQTYFREHAINALQRYIYEGLFESPLRRRSAQVILDRLQKALRYAVVTILPGHREARVQVTGFRFQFTSRGKWNRKVRSGVLSIVVWYPGQEQPVRASLQANPGESITRRIQPPLRRISGPSSRPLRRSLQAAKRPPVRPQPRKADATMVILGWSAVITGAAALIAGGAFLGIGGWARNEMFATHRTAKASPSPSIEQVEQIQSLRGLSEATFIAGGVGVGVGAILATIGSLILWRHASRRPPSSFPSTLGASGP